MPELPEVETIKNELLPHIIGRSITEVSLSWDGIIRGIAAEEFRARLRGQKITSLTRRGKYLIFNLAGTEKLVIHLKLTGSLLIKKAGDEPERFARAIIYLDNATSLQLRDPRKFGRMWLTADLNSIIGKLGPEPLTADFSLDLFRKRLDHRSTLIKPLLLDQNFVAGIGNMYADESLFDAKIHPARPTGSLSPEEIGRLYQAIQKVLKAAIGDKGASVQNYFRPGGETGTAHYQFKVAHRRGKNCLICDTPLSYLKLRNRGTYFCRQCQPERPQNKTAGR